MGPSTRRPTLILIAVLLVASLVLALRFRPSAGPAPVTSNLPSEGAARSAPARDERAAPGATDRAGARTPQAPDVRLDVLGAARPEPVEQGRNPFRFYQPPPPPPAPAPTRAPRGAPASPDQPAPPPPPPIPLKFIGIVEPSGKGTVAVLSDGRFVYHGREGDIIEGRYRIVRIGVESIEMEHVDGRGRQVIRLSGS